MPPFGIVTEQSWLHALPLVGEQRRPLPSFSWVNVQLPVPGHEQLSGAGLDSSVGRRLSSPCRWSVARRLRDGRRWRFCDIGRLRHHGAEGQGGRNRRGSDAKSELHDASLSCSKKPYAHVKRAHMSNWKEKGASVSGDAFLFSTVVCDQKLSAFVRLDRPAKDGPFSLRSFRLPPQL
jgi:hypothetical protein